MNVRRLIGVHSNIVAQPQREIWSCRPPQ
jgi:hypothetical protein